MDESIKQFQTYFKQNHYLDTIYQNLPDTGYHHPPTFGIPPAQLYNKEKWYPNNGFGWVLFGIVRIFQP